MTNGSQILILYRSNDGMLFGKSWIVHLDSMFSSKVHLYVFCKYLRVCWNNSVCKWNPNGDCGGCAGSKLLHTHTLSVMGRTKS